VSLSWILQIFLVLAVIAIVWWGIERIGVPEPIKTIVLVIMALIALFWIFNVLTGGHLALR
jgi:Co/Zn/Cd efflux system component